MRTTIDIPDNVMKMAKIKAIEQGITLKEFFLKALANELGQSQELPEQAPWKSLLGKGSSNYLDATDSPFEDYSGPDWITTTHVNEPPH